MKYRHLFFLWGFFLLCTKLALGYVPSLTTQLKPLYWASPNTNIALNFNPVNSSGISESKIEEIVNDAVAEWGDVSGSAISFSLSKNLNTGDSDKNEIFFSDDSSIFGSGVIGIALVSYKDSTGEILEADIALNDSIDFSSDKDSSLYLGNVLTHEMGHFLGLGHEPTLESTMFYQAERGQFKLSLMDKQSLLQLYNTDNTYGNIEGKIIGGNGLIGLFGVQVMALRPDGKIAATQISDPEGKFYFKGLSANEVYYIYTKPLTFKSSLPSIYADARSNFCVNGESFRGSFLQSCMKSDEGFPSSILVNSNSTKSVGNITVRCGFDVPQSYFSAKDNNASYDLGFNKFLMSTAFTGYFNAADMAEGKEDVIEFTIPSDAIAVGEQNSFDLRINFRSQVFYSIYKADFYVYKNSVKVFGRTTTTSDLVIEDDKSLNLDKDISIPVAMGDEIQIRIKPKDWYYYLQSEENSSPIKPSGRRTFVTKDFFPGFMLSSFDYGALGLGEATHYKNSMALKDPLNLYFLSIETRHSPTGMRLGSRGFLDSDNSQCPDAPNAYMVKNPLAASQSTTPKSKNGKIKSDIPLGCGSLETNSGGNGPTGGMGQMIFGFAIVFLINRLRKKIKSLP